MCGVRFFSRSVPGDMLARLFSVENAIKCTVLMCGGGVHGVSVAAEKRKAIAKCDDSTGEQSSE